MDKDTKIEFLEKTLKNTTNKFEEIEYMSKKIIDRSVSRVDRYALITKIYSISKDMAKDIKQFTEGDKNEERRS